MNNIKTDLQEVGWGGAWNGLIWLRMWWAPVNAVMNLRVP